MLSCREVADFCFDFLEGALPGDTGARFRMHLSKCPDCVRFFETYRKTPELTREALHTEMPESVRMSVRAFLRSRCQP